MMSPGQVAAAPYGFPSYERESRKPGLIALSDGVRALLPKLGINATVTVLGWKQREQQINQGPGGANRVSFMPGKEPSGTSGAGGTLAESKDFFPTRSDAQSITSNGMICTVSIWAADSSSAGAAWSDERQFWAWSDLFQATVFAMHSAVDPDTGIAAGLSSLEFGAYRFTKPPTDRAFGLESLLEFTQYGPILAPKITQAFPQVAIIQEPIT